MTQAEKLAECRKLLGAGLERVKALEAEFYGSPSAEYEGLLPGVGAVQVEQDGEWKRWNECSMLFRAAALAILPNLTAQLRSNTDITLKWLKEAFK